jgi:hypothetical protein
MSVKAAYKNGEPLERVEGAKPGKVYTASHPAIAVCDPRTLCQPNPKLTDRPVAEINLTV